jgi:LPXTG-motif cell wall-anchored protein
VAVKTPDEPVVVELRRAPVMAVQPSGEEVVMAQVVTPPPAEVVQPTLVAQNDPPQLPKTGSDLPLMALFGMLAVGGALILRFAPKRTV